MVSSFDKYDAELVRLRQLIARKHEHYPEWTLEQCAHAAVEEFNDPKFEPNPAFREWLLGQVSVEGQADVRGEDQR